MKPPIPLVAVRLAVALVSAAAGLAIASSHGVASLAGTAAGALLGAAVVALEWRAGKKYLGQSIDVTVTSVLQTAAGRMIFTRLREEEALSR